MKKAVSSSQQGRFEMQCIINNWGNTENKIGKWLDVNPNWYTIAVIIDHLIRTMSMYGLMLILPYSTGINCAICLGASLFYRITIEVNNCNLRFALPSCLGAFALHMAIPVLTQKVAAKS